MKTFITGLLVIFASASLAQNLARQSVSELVNHPVLVVIPQQSVSASQTVPVIEFGGMRLPVSQASSAEARIAIQNMYFNAGGFQLNSQDANTRKFHARVTGKCMVTGGLIRYQYGVYIPYPGVESVCQYGSQFVVSSLTPASVGEAVNSDSENVDTQNKSDSERSAEDLDLDSSGNSEDNGEAATAL